MLLINLIVVKLFIVDICNSVRTHVHTQMHIHTDFLIRVSVYVSVLGLQGFGMSLEPGPETHKDRPATGCEEGVVHEFSHSPTDPGTHTGHTTHTVVNKPVGRAWLWFDTENLPKTPQRQ